MEQHDNQLNMLQLYEHLTQLTREQLDALTYADDPFIQLEALEQQKKTIMKQIEAKSYSDLSAEAEALIVEKITSLQKHTDMLVDKIQVHYEKNSKEMKQTNIQRKTLQTYGGVNYSDVVSMYIDSKK